MDNQAPKAAVAAAPPSFPGPARPPVSGRGGAALGHLVHGHQDGPVRVLAHGRHLAAHDARLAGGGCFFSGACPGPTTGPGDWKVLTLLCLMQPCAYFLLEGYAVSLTTSAQAGMVSALVPLLVAAGAWAGAQGTHVPARHGRAGGFHRRGGRPLPGWRGGRDRSEPGPGQPAGSGGHGLRRRVHGGHEAAFRPLFHLVA